MPAFLLLPFRFAITSIPAPDMLCKQFSTYFVLQTLADFKGSMDDMVQREKVSRVWVVVITAS
jgi:hypothetical protein